MMNDRLEELFDLRFDWVKGFFGPRADVREKIY
jgi:hypothetical protein